MGPEMEACPFSSLFQDTKVDVDEKNKIHEIDPRPNGKSLVSLADRNCRHFLNHIFKKILQIQGEAGQHFGSDDIP